MMAFWPLSQIALPSRHLSSGRLVSEGRCSRNVKMTIEWVCKHHSDLGKEQLYALLKLRAEVFVVEQQCVYQDVDGQDLEGDTCHLMGWDGERLVAYLRLLDPELQGGDVVIGRVVTAPESRGQGLGHEMMDQALKQAEKRWPEVPIYLSAQAHLQGYYGRYGFVVAGEEYVEDGIPHIGMRRSWGPLRGQVGSPHRSLLQNFGCSHDLRTYRRSEACPRRRQNRRHEISGIFQHRFNLPQIALNPTPINRSPLTNPITPRMVTRAVFLLELTHNIQIRQRRDGVLGCAPRHAGHFGQCRDTAGQSAVDQVRHV